MTHLSYSSENEPLEQKSDLVLEYKMRPPTLPSGNSLAIILLHGVGSNEHDLFGSLAATLPQNAYIISARAPLRFGPASFGWYEVDFSSGKPVYNPQQAQKSKELIAQFIDQVSEKHKIKKGNTYLVGFSQGAIMSYSVALTFPEKAKGIAALSGRMLIEDQEVLQQRRAVDFKVFITHSQYDNVLPFQYAKEAQRLLEGKTTGLVLHTHSAGHGLNAPTVQALTEWLEG